jgi:peptidyl-prolyl cis-trans isomerase C
MLRHFFRAALLGFLGLLLVNGLTPTFAQEASSKAAADQKNEAIAVVNGKPIPKELFEAYAQQRRAQIGDKINDPEVHKALLDAMVTQELLVQQAKKENLDKDPQVVAQMEQLQLQLEMVKRNLLTRAMIDKVLSENQPSEEDIEKEYKAMEGKQEYKARHILVDSKEKAEEVIKKLNEGADFAELAKSESSDSSAAQGGDLGWFTTDMMVQSFSEAVAKLEKGKYTEEPVQTRFGWHVILLEDVRQAKPPTLEQVRPQIVQKLQRPMINDYVEKLKEQAQIEIKDNEKQKENEKK